MSALARSISPAVLVALVLLGTGCAGPGGASTGRAAAEAEHQIARLAAREAHTTGPAPERVPVPPGVSPSVLLPAAPTDPAAVLPLPAAIEDVALREVDPPPPPGEPLEDEAADRALRHYAKGRDAVRRKQWLIAVTELERARALDSTSPVVLRELAHAYAGVRNDGKAAALFEELLRLNPDDSETLFILGLDAFNRRDFRLAASYLARPRLLGRRFDHDAAAGALGDYMLATSLRHLGYDLAWIELGATALAEIERLMAPTVYQAHLDLLYRQRAETWREIGDALCRLDHHQEALAAYGRSAALPNSDPEALYPRVIYANLSIGRTFAAQAALLESLGGGLAEASDGHGVVSVGSTTSSPRIDDVQPLRPSHGGEQDVKLCSYVAEQSAQVDLLGRALIERHRARPDDPTLARAAAVLLPRDEALALLRSFLQRRPEDFDVLSQLLTWLMDRDERSAVGLTMALIEDHPRLGAEYGDRLARAARSPSALLRVAREMPPSAARAVVECRLLVYVGANGRAWSVGRDAVQRWPHERWLALQQLDIAARLEEPWLLEQVLDQIEQADDPDTWLVRARARRALGQTELAVQAATHAATLAPASAEAMVVLAAAHVSHAEQLNELDQRRQHAENAVVAAESAVNLDPRDDDAYAILFALHAPNALLADRQRLFELRDQLAENNPWSGLLARLAAQEDIATGRYERALERLLVVCEDDPTDLDSLDLAIAVWSQTGEISEALEWLNARLAQHPADPLLLEEWVALQVGRDQSDLAARRLAEVIAAEPEHDTARTLLAAIHRRDGRHDLAVPLAEATLLTRPQAVRRELELAALYAGAEMDMAALQRLKWILEHADQARFDQLVSSLRVARGLSEQDPSFNQITLEFALKTVERYPEAPLQVYGSAMLAMARQDRVGRELDELCDRAVRSATGADGGTVQAADVWRQLAQELVDAGHPGAAARAVRARLLAEVEIELEPAARENLARVAIIADAASGRALDSIELIRSLALRGALPNLGSQVPRPQLPDIYYEASQIYSLLGHEDGAEQLLREAIRINPDHAMALNNLGYTRLIRGFGDDETEAWIERALELAPEDENVLDTVGWLRYKRGSFEGDEQTPGALLLIRKSIDRSADASAEVLDHLGDTLWRVGDREEAAVAWRQAAEILEDASHREQWEQVYTLVQLRRWGLLVADRQEIYERQFGIVLDRARQKIEAADGGTAPGIAKTFEEAGLTGSRGEDGNGRP